MARNTGSFLTYGDPDIASILSLVDTMNMTGVIPPRRQAFVEQARMHEMQSRNRGPQGNPHLEHATIMNLPPLRRSVHMQLQEMVLASRSTFGSQVVRQQGASPVDHFGVLNSSQRRRMAHQRRQEMPVVGVSPTNTSPLEESMQQASPVDHFGVLNSSQRRRMAHQRRQEMPVVGVSPTNTSPLEDSMQQASPVDHFGVLNSSQRRRMAHQRRQEMPVVGVSPTNTSPLEDSMQQASPVDHFGVLNSSQRRRMAHQRRQEMPVVGVSPTNTSPLEDSMQQASPVDHFGVLNSSQRRRMAHQRRQEMPVVGVSPTNTSPLEESMEQDAASQPPHPDMHHGSESQNVSQAEPQPHHTLDDVGIPEFFQPAGLTAEQKERWLPARTYVSSNENREICCICISDINNGEEVRQLPCRHDIHKSCLDQWLQNHSFCPLCRRDLRLHQ